MPDFSIENEVYLSGYKNICGVDEAGRGPLCGPVVAAACILDRSIVIEGLNDLPSKSAIGYEIIKNLLDKDDDFKSE